MTEQQKKQGKVIYKTYCSTCHADDGKGTPGVGPPLAGSEWVLGPAENLIRIQLRGLKGPIKVQGRTYTFSAPMTPSLQYSDEQIAAVISYIRNSWGNKAPAIQAKQVTKLSSERGKPRLRQEDLKSPFKAKQSIPAPFPPPPSSPSHMDLLPWGIIFSLSGILLFRLFKSKKKHAKTSSHK